MCAKNKLLIISVEYPYGLKETFLHTEVVFLAQYFHVEIFPIIKGAVNDKPRELPDNVDFHEPILSRNNLKRVFQGLFNKSPILPYLKDLFFLFKSSKNLKAKIRRWFIHLLTFRTFLSSDQYKIISANPSNVIYFYWADTPVKLLKFSKNKILVRVHGGEVDLPRNEGYITMMKYNFIDSDKVLYLPISKKADFGLNNIKKVNSIVNRLGVNDLGLNPQFPQNGPVRVVSCSNLIGLKRVHLIVQALYMINDTHIQWIHFGDGPLFSEIANLSKDLPPNIDVKLFGRMENAKVLQYYSENYVDLFLNVSEAEGVPVSIMEAFSFGIPCFATDVGGTNEIVNQDNGLLVNKEFEMKLLVDFIQNVRHSSINGELRKNARNTWLSMCNAKANYKDLVDIIDLHLK